MDIRFYQLLTTPLEVALPRLAAIAYDKHMRTVITAEENVIPLLDNALWSYNPQSFLAHGVVDEHASEHPILLTTSIDAQNDATLLMITNGLSLTSSDPVFERVFDIFDGNDAEALQAARQRWKLYKEQDHQMSYAKQREDGGWDIT